MNRIKLGVNIDHIATLRNARGTPYPDLIEAALIAEAAGADSITVHLREDRRHILDADVLLLRRHIKTALNLEIAVTNEMIAIAQKIKPDYCCLVPEKRQELTTEGGLNIIANQSDIGKAVTALQAHGIQVSLFINSDERQIQAANAIKANAIEIHTGQYADSSSNSMKQKMLMQIIAAAQFAKQCGLSVNAGHGLTYENVQAIAAIKEISELNIGHAIISKSIFTGLSVAIKAMQLQLQAARKGS